MEPTEIPEKVRHELQPKGKLTVWKKEAIDWIKTLGLAFVIVLVLQQFVFNLSTVEGHSMNPTLQDEDWLFVNRAVYIWGQPHLGDVVVLEDPAAISGQQEYLVKRIVAGPGDKVEIKDYSLYVNGEKVEEPYINRISTEGSDGVITVPKEHYFVLGDNRIAGQSRDSRAFGTVPAELIKGRAAWILWPLPRLDSL